MYGHILGCGTRETESHELPETGWEEGRHSVFDTAEVRKVLGWAILAYEGIMQTYTGRKTPDAKADVFAKALLESIRKLQPLPP